MGKGISYVVSVLIVTAVAIAATIVVTSIIYPSIFGYSVRREWSFMVTIYDNGYVRVVLENKGWGTSITSVSISDLTIGGTDASVTLTWSPALPLDPGKQAIGSGTATSGGNPVAEPAGTSYEGTLTVTFSDGSTDSRPFTGSVVARG